MSVLKRFVQDTVVYGLATILPRLMSFVLVGLHTDKLATTGYAENTAFYIGAAFLNVFLTYGMETAFFRFFSKAESKEKVYSTVLIALTSTTIIASLLLWLLIDPITGVLELPARYIGFLIGVTVLDTLVVAPFAYLRAKGKAFRFAGFKMANLAIYVVLNFFFLWAIPFYGLQFDWYDTSDILKYIFIANLAASGVTFLLIAPDFFRIKLVFDKQIFIQLWNYGWPVMVAGLAFVINENLDKLMLGNMIDKDVMGAYSGCYKLAVFMTIFIQAFRLGAEPFFFNYAGTKDAPSTYALILKYFVVVGSLGLMIIICFIDFFKELLIRDSSYWMAIGIVPVVILANLFLGIYHNLSIWYKLSDKTRYGMYFSLIGAGITILINWLLIPVIGFMAAAYATLAAYGVMMILSYLWGQKNYRIPYELNRILLYLGTACVLSGISFYGFRENYGVSTILLTGFAAFIYMMERKKLVQLLAK